MTKNQMIGYTRNPIDDEGFKVSMNAAVKCFILFFTGGDFVRLVPEVHGVRAAVAPEPPSSLPAKKQAGHRQDGVPPQVSRT